MLQDEAKLIAEQWEISNLVTSNGCLEKFKPKYSICNKTVSGAYKISDVSKETIESWNESTREITPGLNARDVWNMDETRVAFSTGLSEKTVAAKSRRSTEGKKKRNND